MTNIQAKISDEEIIALLRKQDKQGISSLYLNHSRLFYGVIYRVVKNEFIAENVLQDVFIKIWQNIDSYNPSKGHFMAWAMNIARNASIDMVRSKDYRNNMVTDGIEPETSQHHHFEIDVDNIGLNETIKKLHPKYQQLIELLYFEGYTQAEVAEELKIPLGTVKSRIRRAFQELRIILN